MTEGTFDVEFGSGLDVLEVDETDRVLSLVFARRFVNRQPMYVAINDDADSAIGLQHLVRFAPFRLETRHRDLALEGRRQSHVVQSHVFQRPQPLRLQF